MEPPLTLEILGSDEYRALRVAAGLSATSAEGAVIGLPTSWSAACLRVQGELVGMGRVVGDGELFLLVVDIAVAPAWQGRGLGKRIMHALMDDMRARAPARAIISLIADGAAHRLYEQFGFKRVAPASHGMLMRL